jgi:CheY-like chemotaxis protein
LKCLGLSFLALATTVSEGSKARLVDVSNRVPLPASSGTPAAGGLLYGYSFPVGGGIMTKDPINILLVDDQPAKLLSYEATLQSLGENLIKAGSAREALEHLLKEDIAIVLSDVCMPELDGFELARMIRNHPRFQHTAIIFVSAVALTDPDRVKGYSYGAVDYLLVPVVPELLRAKVRVFADLFRKTRQLELLNAELERRVEERTAELTRAIAELERRVEAGASDYLAKSVNTDSS